MPQHPFEPGFLCSLAWRLTPFSLACCKARVGPSTLARLHRRPWALLSRVMQKKTVPWEKNKTNERQSPAQKTSTVGQCCSSLEEKQRAFWVLMACVLREGLTTLLNRLCQILMCALRAWEGNDAENRGGTPTK